MEQIDFIYKILETFDQYGKSIYLVGGSTRDLILDRKFTDYDFATPCSPHEVLAILDIKEYDEFSFRFGTVKAKVFGQDIEITTFRKESNYIDKRHPSNIVFVKDMQTDSYRRDFTINALYFDIDASIHDFHHGKEDLKNGIIRSIGNADMKITEDPVRIIRALRLQLELDFAIEESLQNAIRKNASELSKISQDRLNIELKKMKKSATIEEIKNLLDSYNLTSYWKI